MLHAPLTYDQGIIEQQIVNNKVPGVAGVSQCRFGATPKQWLDRIGILLTSKWKFRRVDGRCEHREGRVEDCALETGANLACGGKSRRSLSGSFTAPPAAVCALRRYALGR